MTVEARLTFLACSLLWSVLSALHYLFDGVDSLEVGQRFGKWATEYSNLAYWLLDARSGDIDREEIAEGERQALHDVAESMGDSLIFWAGSELRAASHKSHRLFPKISEEMWLYYYYCQWLLRTLDEIDDLLQEPGLRSTRLCQNYQTDITKFEELKVSLLSERPDLDTQGIVDKATAEALQTDMEARAAQLALEWRRKASSAAGDPSHNFSE
jgi:hypothetical protein